MNRPMIRMCPLVVLTFAAPALAAGTDACALLKPEEVQALAPGAKIGKPVSQPVAPLGVSCSYTWGPRTREWGDSDLKVSVLDTTKAFAGHDVETLKQGLAIKARRDARGQSLSVGDAGAFTYEERSHNAMVEALVMSKKSYVTIVYHGDSLARKEQLISLLKAAVGRL